MMNHTGSKEIILHIFHKIIPGEICAKRKEETADGLSADDAHTGRGCRLMETLLYLAVSFALMLLLTRSSFLYPYNNWDDANSYLSMGKSMFHGAVIYRDLFDQKGPYLYFLYGLCSLISRTDFTGVFVMEVLLGAVDLWLLRRILRLYCAETTSWLFLPVLFSCMCASKSFYWGGSAEEICLPFLLYPLYLLLRTLEEGNRGPESARFRERNVFAAGLCCGVVFCIKFTLMGFYLAFAVVVILTCRSGREFLRLAGRYLLGIVLPFIPWLIYFAACGALDDWYRVYIYTNVFVYSDFGGNSHGETMAVRLYELAKLLYWLIRDNIQYFIFIIAGLLWMLLRGPRSILCREPGGGLVRPVSRIAPVLIFGLTFFFIYIGGATLPYYAVPLTTLSVTGMAAAGSLIDRIAAGAGERVSLRFSGNSSGIRRGGCTAGMAVLSAAAAALSLLICYHYSWNTWYLSYEKEDVFLYQFTADIEADREAGLVDPDNTTLLNIGCLDCGLYTTADIYPTCYWFQTQTLPGDEVTSEQLRYITEGQTDYVVARDTWPEELLERYEMMDSFHQVMGTSEFDYYLFRNKEITG